MVIGKTNDEYCILQQQIYVEHSKYHIYFEKRSSVMKKKKRIEATFAISSVNFPKIKHAANRAAIMTKWKLEPLKLRQYGVIKHVPVINNGARGCLHTWTGVIV